MSDEVMVLKMFSKLCQRMLIVYGTDGWNEQTGAFVNCHMRRFFLHINGKSGLTCYMNNELVYSEDREGTPTSRHLPLLQPARKLMKRHLILDDLANV